MSTAWVVAIAATVGGVVGARVGYVAGRIRGWLESLRPYSRLVPPAPADPSDREA